MRKEEIETKGRMEDETGIRGGVKMENIKLKKKCWRCCRTRRRGEEEEDLDSNENKEEI